MLLIIRFFFVYKFVSRKILAHAWYRFTLWIMIIAAQLKNTVAENWCGVTEASMIDIICKLSLFDQMCRQLLHSNRTSNIASNTTILSLPKTVNLIRLERTVNWFSIEFLQLNFNGECVTVCACACVCVCVLIDFHIVPRATSQSPPVMVY